MPRELILGTAGHIDHGKTSLVKALTGIDCDRLPEEKARGITIDIGFAHLLLGDYHIGIVDVPGHERFIKNMLAGATGMDLCILVVAVDDSIMPQTREHLEILKLLGIRHGVIAVTKVDLVDETTREVVELEIRELVKDTFLENAPLIATSAHTRLGLDDLKSALLTLCQKVETHTETQIFRLAIDRSFVVQGHGTVVTGSVTSGHVRVGEELEWLPSKEQVRVRSLHNHDTPVEEVHRGMRAAINLAGVRHEEVVRGQELATPGYLEPSTVLTLRLHCLADVQHPIKHRASIRFHIGTAEVMGTLSLLDHDRLDPGKWGLAQVFLEDPVVSLWGQPFVVRGPSAMQTLGGGQVLQPDAYKIRRRHLDAQERLASLGSGTAEQRTLAVAWFSGYRGLKPSDLVRGAGLSLDRIQPTIDALVASERLAAIAIGNTKTLFLHVDILKELDERVCATLKKLHDENPLMSSHDRQKIQATLSYVEDEHLVHAAVDRLILGKRVVGDARRIALAEFKPKLSQSQRKLREKMIVAFYDAKFEPPDLSGFAAQAGGQAGFLKDLVEVCVAEGLLTPVNDDLYLHADHATEMRRRVEERLRGGSSGLTVAEIRDLLGTTRKYAVPFCEFLDRSGITRRQGDLRVLAQS